MAILTQKEIFKYIRESKLSFDPQLDQFQLQPIGIDLRAGKNFFIPKLSDLSVEGRLRKSIDHINDAEKNEILDQVHLEPGQVFELLPGEFVLISSLESVNLNTPELMAVLYPRSSTSRRGLLIQSGTIEPFFNGHLTIPIFNMTNTQVVKIYPGERIVQLVFHELATPVSKEEAMVHGLSTPKYQGVKAYNLDYKFDPHDEIKMLTAGELAEIKRKFKVIVPDSEDGGDSVVAVGEEIEAREETSNLSEDEEKKDKERAVRF